MNRRAPTQNRKPNNFCMPLPFSNKESTFNNNNKLTQLKFKLYIKQKHQLNFNVHNKC